MTKRLLPKSDTAARAAANLDCWRTSGDEKRWAVHADPSPHQIDVYSRALVVTSGQRHEI